MNGFKDAIRGALRPAARFARRMLETPPPEVVEQWCTISEGPAKGCHIRLPVPSGFADQIIPGQYEPLCAAVMAGLVHKHSVCLDIGGHYGYFTLVLASLANEGRVDTFEPVPDHAERIAESARRSKLSHVTVHQEAIADAKTTMTLRCRTSGNHDSMSYLDSVGGIVSEAANEQYPSFESLSVNTRTLDDLMELRPDFIKIDAEGAEAAILRGGINLLSSSTSLRLLVEVHGVREAFECANVLQGLGYRAVMLGPQATTLPLLCVSQHDSESLQILEQIQDATPSVIFESTEPSRDRS